jgi:hypothetical protein
MHSVLAAVLLGVWLTLQSTCQGQNHAYLIAKQQMPKCLSCTPDKRMGAPMTTRQKAAFTNNDCAKESACCYAPLKTLLNCF